MAASYFICDVHLGVESPAEEEAKEDRLLHLFERMEEDADTLYILGDLFDFWFEYRRAVPRRSLRTLGGLRRLADRGVTLHYLAGNHDFALGPYLADEVGCILHPEPFETTIGPTRFLLHHGDGLAGRDTGYRILKAVLRSRIAHWLWRWIHPDLGMRLADRVSRASRKVTSGKDYGPDDRIYENIEKMTAGKGYDFLLMGHTHTPDDRLLESGTHYLNLGTWLGGGTPFARFEAGTLEVILPDGTTRRYPGTSDL
jgi:UDP-2,3-diacylglucosamine hydrolase